MGDLPKISALKRGRLDSLEFQKWLGVLGIGLSATWVFNWCFDFILYPLVIYTYGILWGSLGMAVLSFLTSYGLVLFYDFSGKDWLGIETLKELKESNPKSIAGKFTAWILKNGDLAVMTFLSIKFDPFITVVYMRHGAHQYDGFSRRDWKIFITSSVISNAYWALVVYTGIAVVEVVIPAQGVP